MKLVVDEVQHGGGKPAEQVFGADSDRLEYRLHVRGRGGDHLQDVGRGGLPLQRFPRFVEQPRVLDGDHGLIGECLDDRELSFRKPESGLRVGKDDRADALLLIKQRRHR